MAAKTLSKRGANWGKAVFRRCWDMYAMRRGRPQTDTHVGRSYLGIPDSNIIK